MRLYKVRPSELYYRAQKLLLETLATTQKRMTTPMIAANQEIIFKLRAQELDDLMQAALCAKWASEQQEKEYRSSYTSSWL